MGEQALEEANLEREMASQDLEHSHASRMAEVKMGEREQALAVRREQEAMRQG